MVARQTVSISYMSCPGYVFGKLQERLLRLAMAQGHVDSLCDLESNVAALAVTNSLERWRVPAYGVCNRCSCAASSHCCRRRRRRDRARDDKSEVVNIVETTTFGLTSREKSSENHPCIEEGYRDALTKFMKRHSQRHERPLI